MYIKTCFFTCSVSFPASWHPEVQESWVVFFQRVTLRHRRAGPTTNPSELSQMAQLLGKLLGCHQSEFYSGLRCHYGSVLKTRTVSRTEISVRVANMSETEDLKKFSDIGEKREYGWTQEAHGRIQ